IWASMRPYRVPHEEPKGSDARMAAAYRKAHSTDSERAPAELVIIHKGTFCSKCMMHITLCRTYGENLRKAEAAARDNAILKQKNQNIQHKLANQ
ncbi:hypothetical protein KR093_010827, partial [Drosophila rubida]